MISRSTKARPPTSAPTSAALSQWGDRGVLALLSDSTNAEGPGTAGGEDDVIPAFEEILDRTRGRVLVSCFATSIPRMQRVGDAAVRQRRPVSFLGRRMVDNATVARDLGLLRLPEGSDLAADAIQSDGHRPLADLRLRKPGRAAVRAIQGEPWVSTANSPPAPETPSCSLPA